MKESLPLLILKEESKGKLSGMLPNTKWEAAHLATECARKLTHLETLEAVQKLKIASCCRQSAITGAHGSRRRGTLC
jgi:hypothetical protein